MKLHNFSDQRDSGWDHQARPEDVDKDMDKAEEEVEHEVEQGVALLPAGVAGLLPLHIDASRKQSTQFSSRKHSMQLYRMNIQYE